MDNQSQRKKPNISPQIGVIAGVNGAGKTSVIGSSLVEQGVNFIDPDSVTREILKENSSLNLSDANGIAWRWNVERLRDAIERRTSYYFETTLGGETITRILEGALDSEMVVRIWYVGLDSVESHIRRVQERVSAGGHDIPEDRIRERYDNSRRHLIRLLPRLTELLVIDNSQDVGWADTPDDMPILLHWKDGRIINIEDLGSTPNWAKPIIEQALRNHKDGG